MNIGTFLITLGLVGVFIYTFSYAKWVWKSENKLGAVAVIGVGAASLLLPVYLMFFRQW